MTLRPLFTSPCDLGQRIPSMVSQFLELENQVHRRFREDSITDIIVASLLQVGGPDVRVLTPSETLTGSDFDVVILDPSTGEAIQYRIQAKRLHPHAKDWFKGSYKELTHPGGTGAQASTLIRSSAHEAMPTIPLYAFYNPEGACRASGDAISGVELASGAQISAIVKALIAAKPKRPPWKRVGVLQGLFFPFATILCPPSGASPSAGPIVHPRDSRRAVESAIDARVTETPLRRLRLWDTPQAVPSLPGVERPAPKSRQDDTRPRLPAVIRMALESGPEQPIIRARVKRTRVLLIARQNPRE